jgi:hypothetical protein
MGPQTKLCEQMRECCLLAQRGRCWRMIYENPVDQGTHRIQPVEWVGRWKFLYLLDEGVVLRGHADELAWARRTTTL